MSKEMFISEITALLEQDPDIMSKEAKQYFLDVLCASPSAKAKNSTLSENGVLIIKCMQAEPDKCFNSKELGAAIGKTSRSASGSMRKLVEMGLVQKGGKDPVVYKITEEGLAYTI